MADPTPAPILPPAPAARRGRLLARGERGVAAIGLAMTATLLCAFSANVYLIDRATQDTAEEQTHDRINAAGPLLAETASRLLSAGDLPALRRLVANSAQSLHLDACTVTLGSGRTVADLVPSHVNTTQLPDKWALPAPAEQAADADTVRFPFAVAGRGAGFVEMAGVPQVPMGLARYAASGSVCVWALALLALIYRRSRNRLAELELVRSALYAAEAGETNVAALQVDARLGPAAASWNKLLDEMDGLRQRTRIAAAATAHGNRRTGGNNLESACDAMSQGIVLVDDKMRVRFGNGAAATFLKLDRTKIVGTAAVDLVADDKFKDAIRQIAAGKLRRPVTIELETQSEHGDGLLRVCVRPVRRGDADSAMVIVEDITQQRAAEKARNQFINQVTHELRTPLTNIRLYAETAIEDGEGNAEVRANCLNVINQESRRLERIVSEMLNVAEIEAGSTMVRREEVYFDVLVNDLQRDFKAQAEEKQIALTFDVAPKLPKVSADKDKLTLAIHNLVGNALKYTPAGGKVVVKVDVRDGCVVVDVADTGIGIDKAECEKIFDRFFRSGDPRVGQIVGTGLGLTLAREVMRLHGGDVTVESVIDRGSTFTATLPVALAA